MSKCFKKILGLFALVGVVSLIAAGLVLFFKQDQDLDDDFDDDFQDDFEDSDFDLDDDLSPEAAKNDREYVSLGKSGAGPMPVSENEDDNSETSEDE